ncbi:MAG TPA: BTAD domain-containing putative transcriptional regulator, partial [Gemmatimonadales bacterium]|nr:BTAD domain-containing putative transcriptional regulator [Gemmatimonadales bacterium]
AARLGARTEDAGKLDAAVAWYARAASFSPYEEPLWKRQIEILARQGDRAGAIAVFERFAERLAKDLGSHPGPELRELIAAVRRAAKQPVASPPAAPARPVTEAPVPARPRPWGSAIMALSAAAAIVLVLAAPWRHPATLSVVVAEFTSPDADPALARAVTSALKVDLSQSTGLRVASDVLVRDALHRMVRDQGPLDESTAREVAVREGEGAVVAGEVDRVASGYILSARLLDVRSSVQLWAGRAIAKDSSELLGAIESLSGQLRHAAGESRSPIRDSRPLAQVTTGSLQALRLFSSRPVEDEPPEQAIARLTAAITLDSGFAMAWWRLATIYAAWGRPSQVRNAVMHAYAGRARLPEPERSLAEAYQARLSGDPERGRALLETLLQDHPDEPDALTVLTDMAMRRGDWAGAERYGARGRRPVDRYNTFVVQAAQGHFDAAEHTVRVMSSAPGAGAFEFRLQGELAGARGRYAAAESLLWRSYRAATDSRGNRAGALATLAEVAEVQGHIGTAIGLLERDLQEGALPPDVVIGRLLWIARLETQYRADTTGAVARTRRALASHEWHSLPDVDRPFIGMADAFRQAGDTAQARRLLTEQQAVVTDTTSTRWRAGVVARHELDGDYAGAARILTAGLTKPWPECPSCGMYPIADAWDRAGRSDSALAWYHRALATPGSRRLAADAQWRGRALRRVSELAGQAGNAALADSARRALFGLWATADTGLLTAVFRR